MKNSSIIVVGLQWGDEGKGKLIDYLSVGADCVVRAQGGNNAGHTVVAGGKEYRFHLIPSGILYPHVRCFIGGGTVIDPESLLLEMQEIESQGIDLKGRVLISPYAHVVFPYHRLMDKMYEVRRGDRSIGTTGRGIGPCYADKTQRIGIRLGECLDPVLLRERLEAVARTRKVEGIECDVDSLTKQYTLYAERLAPFIGDVESLLADALTKKQKVLFEGAHGTALDLTFGTYPYVTSSSTIAAGICMGAGIGPTYIDHVLGIAKAYTTRVGEGPLPTALSKEEELLFMGPKDAREIGTTTGRVRRLAWLDTEQLRFSIRLNGVGSLAVTKLDVLDSLEVIKICTSYHSGTSNPIYETLPGWRTSTKLAKKLEDLPREARDYLDRVETLCGVPICLVSVGPERENTLIQTEIF